MAIKAILFDFVGVLMQKRADYIPDALVDGIDKIIGQVTDDNILKNQVFSEFHLTEPKFNEIITKIVDKWEPFPPLWDILPELQTKFQLAIINNGTALTIPAFKSKHPIDKYFKYFISSAIEGIRKPDPKIYFITTEKLGVKPEECIFMDDSLENIQAASALGMAAIHWQTHEQGFTDLQKLLGELSQN